METIDERIARELEKVEQCKRRKTAQETRDKSKAKKLNIRRLIIIGGIVSRFFPKFLDYRPRCSEVDIDIEYAPLINFFKLLAADKNYITQLEEKSCEKIEPEDGWMKVEFIHD